MGGLRLPLSLRGLPVRVTSDYQRVPRSAPNVMLLSRYKRVQASWMPSRSFAHGMRGLG